MPTVIFVLIGALMIGGVSMIFLGPNNPIEEASEEIIEIQTGVDINISGVPECEKQCKPKQ